MSGVIVLLTDFGEADWYVGVMKGVIQSIAPGTRVIDLCHQIPPGDIAAGAFHVSKPSELIPELQGRFPIRVELEKLTEADFRQILTGPRNSLVAQTTALLATEGLELEFTDDGLDEIAAFAFKVNEETENIGARRLHTIMEKQLEETSFDAPELSQKDRRVTVDQKFVRERLQSIVQDNDLSRYIL